MKSVGQRIRWVVEVHLGISYADFSRRLGVSRQLMSRWVNDEENPPSRASVHKIAKEAGVSPAWLEYGQGKPVQRGPGSEDIAGILSALHGAWDALRPLMSAYPEYFDIPEKQTPSFIVSDAGCVLVVEPDGFSVLAHAVRDGFGDAEITDGEPLEDQEGIADQRDLRRLQWAVQMCHEDGVAVEIYMGPTNSDQIHGIVKPIGDFVQVELRREALKKNQKVSQEIVAV